MISKNCITCGSKFDTEEIQIGSKKISFVNYCDPCFEKRTAEAQADAEQQRKDALESVFWSSVPPLYRETDPSILNPILTRDVLSWEYQPKGIGIRGKSGMQKTRAAVMLLYKIKMQGHSVYFLKSTDIARYATDKFSNDRETQDSALKAIRSAHTARVLLIDDIGKGRLSNAAEELLYDILDKRSERQIPVIWTSNSTSTQLHDMMSEDRGDAIIRRLAEFSHKIVTI
jgi:hypothetical protein